MLEFVRGERAVEGDAIGWLIGRGCMFVWICSGDKIGSNNIKISNS